MGRITIPAAVAAGALLAACHPAPLGHPRGAADRPVRVASALDCPDHVGALSLGRRAADGASCSYGGPDGAQVTLTRLALVGGSAQATLASLDAQARALVPGAPDGAAKPGGDGVETGDTRTTTTTVTSSSRSVENGDEDDAPPTPPAPPAPPHEGDRVRIDLPGVHIDADGQGHARVSGFGQHVEADGNGAVVRSHAGGLSSSVVANDRGATVRTGGAGAQSVDAALILSANAAGPDGWRSAGYVARGPLSGPLVAAQVQARGGHSGGDADPFDAARRLVDRNVHG